MTNCTKFEQELLLDEIVLLQVDEAVSNHSPHVGCIVLDVVDTAYVVDADLLLLRCLEDDDNIELAEEFFVLLCEKSGVGVYIDHRIQCLSTNDRSFSAILTEFIARNEKLGCEVEFSNRLSVQERHRLYSGQDDILGDLSTKTIDAGDQDF